MRFPLILILLVTGACAPGGETHVPASAPAAPAPVEVQSTRQPQRPTIAEEQGYRIARGATKIRGLMANYDSKKKLMSLKGAIDYIPTQGDQDLETLQVDLRGSLDAHGFITLKPQASMRLPEGLRLAAKATCLSEAGSCHSSFIDVYIYTDGVVYHHQLESHQAPPATPKPAPAATPAPAVTPTPAPSAQPTPKPSATPAPQPTPHDEEEFEGHDHADGEVGPYVGSIFEDILTILNVPPTPATDSSSTAKDEKAEEEEKAEEKTAESKEEVKEDKVKTPANSANQTAPAPTPKPSPSASPAPTPTPKPSPAPSPSPTASPTPTPAPTPKPTPYPMPRPSDLGKPQTPAQIPKVSQAIGPVNGGRLENAVDMYAYQKSHPNPGFEIIRPFRNTHFATNELAYIIRLIGEETKKLVPGYKTAIGDLSLEKGGAVGRHKSHTNGLDADVGFYFNNTSLQGYLASATALDKPHASWMIAPQWELFKKLVATQLIDRIFIHETLKKELCAHAIKNGEVDEKTSSGVPYQTLRRLIADHDHNTHFHLRVKCSSAQIRCRQMAEPAQGTGCF